MQGVVTPCTLANLHMPDISISPHLIGTNRKSHTIGSFPTTWNREAHASACGRSLPAYGCGLPPALPSSTRCARIGVSQVHHVCRCCVTPTRVRGTLAVRWGKGQSRTGWRPEGAGGLGLFLGEIVVLHAYRMYHCMPTAMRTPVRPFV